MTKSWKAGILAIILCLALLAGCTKQQPQLQQNITTSPTLSQPTGNDPASIDVIATEPPTEPPTEPEKVWEMPDFSLNATHAFVYHTDSDKMIFNKGDIYELIAPASLTKLYSAWAALQYLDPETVISVGSEVTLIDPDSSVAHIYQGQRLTVEQCVEGMLLQSGNDAAYVLAVAAGRAISENPGLSPTAAIGTFAAAMNELALENGLENTHFSNPDGIDASGHYTSMNDLAKISLMVLKDPIMSKYIGMASDEVTYVSGDTASWKNTNELLHPESQFYCEYAVGMKTGSTTNAGKCLISAFLVEDGYLIIGVLGGTENLQRYVDTLNLYHHFTGQPLEEYIVETE